MIRIDVVGLDRAIAAMELITSGRWRERAVYAGAIMIQGQTQRRIAVEKTSPSGGAWAPLAPATVARKGTNNILVDTGRLLGSIAAHVAGTSATIGTSVAYAGYLQGGTSRMPAREFLGLSDANAAELERMLASVIERMIG